MVGISKDHVDPTGTGSASVWRAALACCVTPLVKGRDVNSVVQALNRTNSFTLLALIVYGSYGVETEIEA